MNARTPILVGLALGLVVGIVAAVAIVRFATDGADAAARARANATAVAGDAYTGDIVQEARLVQSEAQRLVYVRTVAATARWNSALVAGPYRVRTGPTFTLVLPARATPYTVLDLQQLAPDTFVRAANGAYLLSENLLVLTGATLALTPVFDTGRLDLRLKSDDQSFVSIVTAGGSLRIDGAEGAPVTITSWNSRIGAPDVRTSDGRAYIRVIGGRAAVSHTSISDLGFWSGNTGGLALTGTDAAESFDSLATSDTGAADDAADVSGAQILPPGTITTPSAAPSYSFVSAGLDNVTIRGNAFGLFVTSADGVVIRDSRIADSLVDGLVFHRFVTDSSVIRTASVDNAVDGFSVARSSTNVTFRDVAAMRNGRDGVTLDGQSLAEGPSATGTAVEKFGDNRVSGSTLVDNGRYGIAVSGGRDITLSSNYVARNQNGIVVDHAADEVALVGNRLASQHNQAIAIRDDVTGTEVVDNHIEGGQTAVFVRNADATVAHNTIAEVSNHGVTLVGDASDIAVTRNTIAGFGSIPIYTEQSTGATVRHNDTLDWRPAASFETIVNAVFQPLTIVWILLALVVLITALAPAARRRAAIRHPYAERVPLSSYSRGIVNRDAMRDAPVKEAQS